MTNGLCKGRNTAFYKGYAIQWFTDIFKCTRIFIYTNVPNNKYLHMSDITLDYVADEFSVISVAKCKIDTIESW